MASDIASRDHYLTLALFSRRIIEALREFSKTGKRGRLNSALPSAIESLRATTSTQHPIGYGIRLTRRYDQVRTITELFPDSERTKMIRTLRALEDDGNSEAQKEAANKAAYFFYAIENRALRNYRHPSPRSPRATTVK